MVEGCKVLGRASLWGHVSTMAGLVKDEGSGAKGGKDGE